MALSFTEASHAPPAPQAEGNSNRAVVAHVEGYAGLRPSRPETTLKSPGGREVPLPSREHTIRKDQERDFSRYLKEDLTRWIEIEQRIGPDRLRDLLNESGHGYYNNLLDRLTEVKKGTGGRLREINADVFRQYMATEPGLTMAYQVTLRKLQELALPAGVYLQMQNPGQEPEMVDNESVTTGKGGPLREAARKVRHLGNRRVDQNYGRQGPTHGTLGGWRRGIQTVNDVIRWNAVASSIGAALGGADPLRAALGAVAAPFATGLAYLSRSGETLNIVQSAKALRAVIGDPHSSDPARQQAQACEVEYMQRFLMIDPHDIVIAGPPGNETVDIKPGPVTTNIDNDTLAENLIGYAKAIMEFQASNHIRRNQIEPMDIRWLIEGSDNPPQQGNPLQERVMERFREMGGVRDMAGVPQRVLNPATREWVDNVAYTPNNHDIALNVATWNEAYTEIMNEDIDLYFGRIMDKGADPEGDRTRRITARKAVYGPTSENARNRKTALTREQTALNVGRELVEGARTSFPALQDHIRTQRRTIVQNERIVQTEQRRVQIIGAGPGDVDLALEQILTVPGVGFTVRIGTEVIGPLAGVYDQIQQDINDAYDIWYNANIEPNMAAATAAMIGALTPEAQVAAQQRIDALTQRGSAYREQLNTNVFRNRLDTYNRQLNLVSGVMERLRGARDTILRAQEELEDRDSEQRGSVERVMEGMQRDRVAVEGWGANPAIIARGPALDLSTNALATVEFAQLQERINEAYRRSQLPPPVAGIGWPPADNNNQRNHEILVRAMVEARAVGLEPRIAAPTADFALAMGAPYNFAELDFVALSDQEIAAIIVARGAGPLTPARIQAIRQEAQARLTARQRALPEVIEQIENRERELTEESTRIDREGVLPPELEVIEKASGRIDAIIEEITGMPREELIEALDPANVGVGRAGYFAGEQALPVVYASIMRWIVDTANDNTARFPGAENGREAALARAVTVITPGVLNAELAIRFGTNLAGLQAEVQARRISPTQLANFIVNDIVFDWMERRLAVA